MKGSKDVEKKLTVISFLGFEIYICRNNRQLNANINFYLATFCQRKFT